MLGAHRRSGRVLMDFVLLPTEIHAVANIPAGDSIASVARAFGNGLAVGARGAARSQSGACRPLPGPADRVGRGSVHRGAHAGLASGVLGTVFDADAPSARRTTCCAGADAGQGVRRAAAVAPLRRISAGRARCAAALDSSAPSRSGMARLGTDPRAGTRCRKRGSAADDGQGGGWLGCIAHRSRRHLWNRRRARTARNLGLSEDSTGKNARAPFGIRTRRCERACTGRLPGRGPSALLGCLGRKILPPRESHAQ